MDMAPQRVPWRENVSKVPRTARLMRRPSWGARRRDGYARMSGMRQKEKWTLTLPNR